MKFPVKGPSATPVGGGGKKTGTINYGAAQTPRAGAENTKAAGGTPPAKPFTGIWRAPVGGRNG